MDTGRIYAQSLEAWKRSQAPNFLCCFNYWATKFSFTKTQDKQELSGEDVAEPIWGVLTVVAINVKENCVTVRLKWRIRRILKNSRKEDISKRQSDKDLDQWECVTFILACSKRT